LIDEGGGKKEEKGGKAISLHLRGLDAFERKKREVGKRLLIRRGGGFFGSNAVRGGRKKQKRREENRQCHLEERK